MSSLLAMLSAKFISSTGVDFLPWMEGTVVWSATEMGFDNPIGATTGFGVAATD